MTQIEGIIKAASRQWTSDLLEAPGLGRRTIVSLEREKKERDEYLEVVRSARTQNAKFLRSYIQKRNRACLNAIHPDTFQGSGYVQESCMGSTAQKELRECGDRVVENFENVVTYQLNPDPDKETWILGEYHPRGSDMMQFTNAAHAQYSNVDFNQDEREFAQALDYIGIGVWARNQPSTGNGFSIPLPAKVDESSQFFPDFLWWIDDSLCWALDTTGKHLLDAKVRGKLIGMNKPRVALIVRGHVDLEHNVSTKDNNKWSLVLARQYLLPVSESFDDLQTLLQRIISVTNL